jgi:hypothetical protein
MLDGGLPSGKGSIERMKRPFRFLVLAICILFAMPLTLAACGDGQGDDALVGVWADPQGVIEYEFKSDGTLVLRLMGDEAQTTYTAKDGKLSAANPDTGEMSAVDYTIEGDNLILGVDGEEGTLIRQE